MLLYRRGPFTRPFRLYRLLTRKQFGVPIGNEKYAIAAQWQSAFNLGVLVGQVVSALGVGWPLDRFERRITLACCCLITCVALVTGIVFGAYPVIAPTYISEVTLALVASALLAGTRNRSDRWSYDIPLQVKFMFLIIILALLPFCLESPWHLVRKGKDEKAERALVRLSHSSVDAKAALAHIKLTAAMELEEEHSERFIDCLLEGLVESSTPLRLPLEVHNRQQHIFGYAVYFFELAGLATSDAFSLGVGLLAVGSVGTCLSWPLINNIGRRRIYNWGLVVLVVLLFLIAILDVIPTRSSGLTITWVQSSLMVVYNFFYDLAIGPLCFVIISETSSAKLRGKTIAIATTINVLINVACAGKHKGKLAFVFFGLSVPCLIWCFLALPETKDRAFDELDTMFLRSVKTRDFKTYVVEAWMDRV
ncbi:Maltose permease MAL31 [Fulvia fulva]|uniref:Maltose permease MAL31 n=1 Tax=Passalora fulva TaxID=5499 RepID=A0A9Q8PDZ2_PASFU|nr:Maltose permease MAL31 [Fulvia fulva]KAK4617661.1 Maltose permease MAL31 [Fulvia fulva]KAK4618469.1 Maltose permease MAL31 [Fulvia fulva]UJO20690.1 Maltose permease MAL31 [Fulvia fulva]WPV18573.1 Maltose permease MAL31 [Fulvia fulva]WPV33090.1 Maltose permease MAL31 [Fulvia fulva]